MVRLSSKAQHIGTGRIGDHGVAQRGEDLGDFELLSQERRGRDQGGAERVRQGGNGAVRTQIFQELGERRLVFGRRREIPELGGLQVEGDVGVPPGAEQDNGLSPAQRAQLPGTADGGFVGAGGEDGEHGGGAVGGLLDLACPGGAAVEAMGVQPGVEALGGEVVLELRREGGPVPVSVREKERSTRRRQTTISGIRGGDRRGRLDSGVSG